MKKIAILIFAALLLSTMAYAGSKFMGPGFFSVFRGGTRTYENYQVSDGIGGWENYQVADGGGWENYQVRE